LTVTSHAMHRFTHNNDAHIRHDPDCPHAVVLQES
jgi:hypothetical protein